MHKPRPAHRAGTLAILLLAAAAFAQPARPVEPPPLAPAVTALLEAGYLTEDELRDARIFHGLWQAEDLDTPGRAAHAALIVGDLDHPALSDPAVSPHVRAQAALQRGEPETALDLLGGLDDPGAARIRAESLEMLGRFDDAVAALEPLARLAASPDRSAPEAVELVRGLMLITRLKGQATAGGGDFHAMNAILAAARERADRLHWPVHLEEAVLLSEKDNARQASEAIVQALSLNPRSVEAWSLLGRMKADTFDLDTAESIAGIIDALPRPRPEGEDAGPSPHAAMLLARIRLRQNDPAAAAEHLAPALARFPRMRPLLALQAAVAAQSYDFERVERLLDGFDRLSPGSARALFEVGKTLSDARQYEQAAGYLRRAMERGPHLAEPVIELGLLGLQSGDDALALDNLRAAVRLDPFNLRASNSLKLVEELVGYRKLETDHFTVRFNPGIDEILAREMLEPLERMHARVTGGADAGIDHVPSRKTTIDLMPNQRWFAVRIAGITRIHTMAAATGPVIAMEVPREGPNHSIGTYDWLRVVRHEYTHTVTLSRTNNRIPHWFTEAAAVFMEDAPRDFSTARMLADALENDALLTMDRINLAFIRPRHRNERGLAYAQGHWMYEFLVERWGPRAPLDLMDAYAAGVRQDAAMRVTLGLSETEFFEQFRAWASPQVVGWGLAPAPGEPAMRDLLRAEFGEEAAEADGPAPPARPNRDRRGADRSPQPTQEMVERWLADHPDHPDVLAAAVRLRLDAADNQPDESMVPLLERYAASRPVDPLPHQLLAKFYLAGPDAAAAIPHLEYLDIREQHSPSYAAELARLHAARKDWAAAVASSTRATTIAPFDAALRELAATIALQARDLGAAERHIVALTLLEPEREIHQRRLDAVRAMRKRENPAG